MTEIIEFIAGKDAGKYDLSDWDIQDIPVYLNPDNLPVQTSIAEAEEMVRLSCFSWTLRYSIVKDDGTIKGHRLIYSGLTNSTVISKAIVINYSTSAQLMEWYGSEVNGLCKYHTDYHNGQKWILNNCEIHINADNRALPNRFARATIKHELGHACGIHDHNDVFGSCMYRSSMGNENLTLADCQMLDFWNTYPVELNPDMSLSAPAVLMPDGNVKWVQLKYSGNGFNHNWRIESETNWQGPVLDNVTFGGTEIYGTKECLQVFMKDVKSKDLKVRADFLFAPNQVLILKYAE